MALYPVAMEEDIPAGTNIVVDIEGRSIGIYNVKGEYYAVHNYCPHQGAEICKGPICGTNVHSEVYRYIYGREQEIIRCPWHGWEFDITTGKSLFSDKVRVRTYSIIRNDGQLFIAVGK